MVRCHMITLIIFRLEEGGGAILAIQQQFLYTSVIVLFKAYQDLLSVCPCEILIVNMSIHNTQHFYVTTELFEKKMNEKTKFFK